MCAEEAFEFWAKEHLIGCRVGQPFRLEHQIVVGRVCHNLEYGRDLIDVCKQVSFLQESVVRRLFVRLLVW